MTTARVYFVAAILASAMVGPPLTAQNASSRKTEDVDGYAEWRKGDLLIVDGQRVRATSGTRFKGKHAKDVASIPLCFEVEAKGTRDPSGVLIAETIEAKPNGMGFLEDEVLKATNAMEAQWLEGHRVQLGPNEKPARLFDSGPEVQRVSRIMQRLTPGYIGERGVRTRVIEREEWNAFAMGNGAVFVHTGLMKDMNDDELAIVLGHELAHYTHEHSRRGMRRAMITQLIAVGVAAAAEAVDSEKSRAVIGLAGTFSLLAWQNGYGRNLEDQADRVGLRYAYEGGYDVQQGPRVWERFRQKYGQENRVANFFFSNHSQAGARQKNLQRELQLNYLSR